MNIPDDEFIRELLPEFLETWLQDIDEKYSVYIAEKNSADLYRLAHTLKGSCYQFGLNEIGDMGIHLMTICKENKWDEAAAMEAPIRNSFADVQTFLQNNQI